MIRSMTGYGQGSHELPDLRVSVEFRSVNNRYADLRFRIPQELADEETKIRRRVLTEIRRGRVEMTVRIERPEGTEARPVLQRPLLDELVRSLPVLREELGFPGELDLQAVLAIPGLFRSESVEAVWEAPERAALHQAIEAGLAALVEDRTREGSKLREDLEARLRRMESLAGELVGRAAEQPNRLRDKLLERLAKHGEGIEFDPARLAQEAAFLADRSDVTEELVRLAGHLEQARALVAGKKADPVGKRLDFLLQEVNREINTVGSKSSDLEVTRLTLDLKAEAEKVREQVQNLE